MLGNFSLYFVFVKGLFCHFESLVNHLLLHINNFNSLFDCGHFLRTSTHYSFKLIISYKCPARLISYPKINRGPVEFQEVVEGPGPGPVQEDVQEESVSSEEQVDIETEVYVQHVENMYISLK